MQKPDARAAPLEQVPERRKKPADAPASHIPSVNKMDDRKTPHRRIARPALRNEIHREIRDHEEDDLGLQAAHETEQAGETIWRHGGQVYETWQHHQKNKAERMGASGSNPISRSQQKQKLKRKYIAENRRQGGKAAGRSAGNAARKTESVAEKAVSYIGKKKHIILLLALGGLLLFVMYALSACTPLLESALQAFVMGTYPAEEVDIRAAERAYADLEKALQDEMNHPERYYPDCDSYIVQANEIWHDPYALISLISAYHNGEEWTIDQAYPTIQMLFRWQYEKEVTITSEQRYHTEMVDGVETKVWHSVTVCTITLKNKNLSHAPVYIMSKEKVGLYALYMSTLGNMPDLFSGPHVSAIKDPLEYEVPQKLLDDDPKFAALVEEANKRLGYPYVWGGYTPETSFDCSGFISWIFTETGVRNIGHMGATGLYGISQKISEEELLPGDVIYFSGTIEGEDGITHCGLYVGNGMMIHCGNPCSYYDIAHGSLKNNIAGYGRLYSH